MSDKSGNHGLRIGDEPFALLQEILHAMPKPDMIRHLYEIFTTCCLDSLLNVVYTPTFLDQAEELYPCLSCGEDEEQQVNILSSKHPPDTLACHLFAVGAPH